MVIQLAEKADLIEQMLGICPERDLDQLGMLTHELISRRDNPHAEKGRFEGAKSRGIPGFHGAPLPRWRRILVTGGTGCIGQTMLGNLRTDLPGARLVSVARHPPPARRRVKHVTYLQGDVRDPIRMADVLAEVRPDLIVHLAAQRDPAYAEVNVAETVSTNVYGTRVVLQAAGQAGVGTVVMASTGKAVRLFTSDVYAATKKLAECEAGKATERYGISVSCARFTHVVDNSIVAGNLSRWITNGEPILLHSPHTMLPVQSALESYHLLMTASAVAEPERVMVLALRDLGWPPVTLLDLTLDYLAESPASRSPIIFTGYPAGYEACAYPGTYDPLTAGDVSPLVNCAEAARTQRADLLGDAVDQFDLRNGRPGELDADLAALCETSRARLAGLDGEQLMGGLLRIASTSLLRQLMSQSKPELLTRVHRLGQRHDRQIADHRFIHEELGVFLGADQQARR